MRAGVPDRLPSRRTGHPAGACFGDRPHRGTGWDGRRLRTRRSRFAHQLTREEALMSTKDWLEKDYYKILGVSKDAKPDEIKKAFRKLARENHPDQHPDDKDSERRFKEISEANSVLSDLSLIHISEPTRPY